MQCPTAPAAHRPPARAAVVAIVAAVAALAAGCTAGPDYVRPSLAVPAAYKEGDGWKRAEPGVADSRQPWWEAYGDPVLDRLMQDAEQANQNLRLAEANYRQAQALVDAARAALYPGVGANLGAQRARTDTNGIREVDTLSVGLGATWVPDFWGGVRRSIEAGRAGAQASADDLAGAHLSIQASLAQAYFQLRVTDAQRDLYAATIEAYARALKLTQAQRAAGVAQASDVALAQSQLAGAQATAADLDAVRAQFEHALAVLTGRAPADFSLPAVAAASALRLPPAPVGLPSELLERRPDIAAAERRAAAANANIGVARAAFYPSVTLNASGGFGASAFGALFDTPSRVWSLGAALAQTLFDGGLRNARDAQAVAAYDAAVATYKETVLAGFQQVEDALATLRVLDREAVFQDQAVEAGRTAERLSLAQYRGGTATYLAVVTAQTLSLANQRTAVALRGRQLGASVSLVTATGGGWRVPGLRDPNLPGAAGPSTSAADPGPAVTTRPTT